MLSSPDSDWRRAPDQDFLDRVSRPRTSRRQEKASEDAGVVGEEKHSENEFRFLSSSRIAPPNSFFFLLSFSTKILAKAGEGQELYLYS